MDIENAGEVEIITDEDGGVTVDFDPIEITMVEGGFYDNIADQVGQQELQAICSDLLSQFDANKSSRQEWEDAYSEGLELLGFTYEERTQPFRGSSGVTHPLLAEAANSTKHTCLLYTSPSPRDRQKSRMPSSA